jgi:hypothetical protein
MSTAAYKEMKKEMKTKKNASLFNGHASKSPEEFFHIEVKLTDHEKAVVEMLKLVADGTWKTNEKYLNTVGDLYTSLRALFGEGLSLKKMDISSASTSASKKADKIREKNVLEKVKDASCLIEKLIEGKMWKSPPEIHSDLIETRLLAMMYHMNEMSKNLEDNIPEEKQYDLAFGASKILSKLKTIQVKHKQDGQFYPIQSSKLIEDFADIYNRYIEKCEFDILHASVAYPKFFIKTSYDHILPGMAMSPYNSQLQVMDLVKTNKKNGCLIWLNTLTGEGKTSLVVAIAKWALNMRTYRDKDMAKAEVIYCCSEKLKAIRQQVGQYAWNAALPFGIATTESTIDHPSYCKKECPRVLTIADVETTIQLLLQNLRKENKEKRDYILFFDEPTFTLDKEDSEMIPLLSEIFNVMPRMTIFSTATAPEKEKIPRIEAIFRGMYPESVIQFVTSMRVQIGSEISNFKGSLFLPHSGCQTIEEYKKVVEKIQGNGFLQKCYTATIVNGMYTMLSRFSKKYPSIRLTDLESYMKDTEKMNQQSIQTLGLEYLKSVLEVGDNDLVRNFCKVNYQKESMSFETLCTDYKTFENQTLIVTENPLDFFDKYMSGYLQTIEKELGTSFAEMYKEYNKNLDLFLKEREEKLEEFQKSIKAKSADEKDRALYEKIQELEMYRPRLSFPEKFIIGSKSYYKENKENDEEGIKKREYTSIDRLDLDSLSCQDKHQLGLVVGVGILSKDMSPSYLRKVSELSLKGLLAYVIADDDICYGTNYPIENVIVDECMSTHSAKTIFQVFARAGRPGKSWRASIFAHDAILEKIRQYVFDRDYIDVETVHMNQALDKVEIKEIKEIVEKKEKECEQIEKKEPVKVVEIVADSWEDEI